MSVSDATVLKMFAIANRIWRIHPRNVLDKFEEVGRSNTQVNIQVNTQKIFCVCSNTQANIQTSSSRPGESLSFMKEPAG